MFTGIITDKGKLKAKNSNNGLTIEVETSYDTKNIAMGASVACSGVCLTVVAKADGLLSFDVSEETISKTNVGEWKVGDAINFERPLKVGDELGGHIVSGHVDGVVEIIDISDDDYYNNYNNDDNRNNDYDDDNCNNYDNQIPPFISQISCTRSSR